MTDPITTALAYHARTKHQLDRYAAGPDALDWDAQPDPFRHWRGTTVTALPREVMASHVRWPQLDQTRPAHAFTSESLGSLLRLCAGITAWKQYAGSRWSLRAHPSSGNLHPTETWLIAKGVAGLGACRTLGSDSEKWTGAVGLQPEIPKSDRYLEDGLYHYQASDHSLERRAWEGDGKPGVWLGYSSIPWREAWKYGERAFRYCQLDMGHVLAALACAAALHGWRPRLLMLDPAEVTARLGLNRGGDFDEVEAEEGEVIVNLQSEATPPPNWTHWAGQPSLLDPKPMYRWPVIEEVAEATRGPLPHHALAMQGDANAKFIGATSTRAATEVILQRRSAQAFDGKSVMPHALFRRLLAALLPGGAPVWRLWPHAPRVHPVLMVHRVEGIKPGLYALPRADAALAALKQAMPEMFAWTPADPDLPLQLLLAAKTERTARTLSCHQDIASHGAATFLFIAEFEAPIRDNPAAWRHLHWEAGMLGHCLTLEAEAAGWRGTGIGCFFDDAVHEVLGLGDTKYQVIYHYAIGIPIDDPRLTTLPAYP